MCCSRMSESPQINYENALVVDFMMKNLLYIKKRLIIKIRINPKAPYLDVRQTNYNQNPEIPRLL